MSSLYAAVRDQDREHTLDNENKEMCVCVCVGVSVCCVPSPTSLAMLLGQGTGSMIFSRKAIFFARTNVPEHVKHHIRTARTKDFLHPIQKEKAHSDRKTSRFRKCINSTKSTHVAQHPKQKP